MITFIHAETVKTKKEKIDLSKIDEFIHKFNKVIMQGDDENEDNSFSLNDGLNRIPTLNDHEFKYATILAADQGWMLTQFEDNYSTITYKMKKINS